MCYNRTSFLSAFTPISYLTLKCMFLLLKTRINLRRFAIGTIKQERIRKLQLISHHAVQSMSMDSIGNVDVAIPEIDTATIKLGRTDSIGSMGSIGSINSIRSASSIDSTEIETVNELMNVQNAGIQLSTIDDNAPDPPTNSMSINTKTSKTTTSQQDSINEKPSDEKEDTMTATVTTRSFTPKSDKKYLFDPNHNKIFHVIANGLVLFFSLLFVGFGTSFMIVVFEHFETAIRICAKESMLFDHPELYLWDQCVFKTFPFDSDYPCNCRQVKIDLNETSTTNVSISSIIESMFENWDMLQVVYITDANKDGIGINLTQSDHYSAKYLKILHLDEIRLNGLSNDVSNWKNLEYLYLSHAHFPSWPNGFNSLNKIGYLKLWDVQYLSEFPPNLCNMYNLRALNIYQAPTSAVKIKTLPECVINLNNLQSIVFYAVLIDKFPIDIFTMSSIEEIGFLLSNLTLNSFIYNSDNEKDGYDKNTWQMEWNPTSQTTYYFAASPICYHELSNYTQFPNRLIEFLDDTNGCSHACSVSSVQQLECTPVNWQNGVCDEQCNNFGCYYDGGDCNQLCQYYYPNCSINEMFDNGKCDIECNNTFCSFDSNECIDQFVGFNLSQVFGKNKTYCDLKSSCEISWINDGWCDENCRSSDECFNDGNDCICEQNTYCQQFYSMFSSLADDTITDGTYVSLDGFCSLYTWLPALFPAIEQYIEGYNCSTLFNILDRDNDTFIDFYEFGHAANEFSPDYNLTEAKLNQLNCSSCIE